MDHPVSFQIVIASQADGIRVRRKQLLEAVAAVLRRHRRRRASVGISLVDDRTMARLNWNCLGHRGSTDVLTFDYRDKGETGIDGEIVASVDTARREALARGHGLSAELTLYVVHGMLHLLGYDDASAPAAARMHRMEDSILKAVGVGPVYARGAKAAPRRTRKECAGG